MGVHYRLLDSNNNVLSEDGYPCFAEFSRKDRHQVEFNRIRSVQLDLVASAKGVGGHRSMTATEEEINRWAKVLSEVLSPVVPQCILDEAVNSATLTFNLEEYSMEYIMAVCSAYRYAWESKPIPFTCYRLHEKGLSLAKAFAIANVITIRPHGKIERPGWGGHQLLPDSTSLREGTLESLYHGFSLLRKLPPWKEVGGYLTLIHSTMRRRLKEKVLLQFVEGSGYYVSINKIEEDLLKCLGLE